MWLWRITKAMEKLQQHQHPLKSASSWAKTGIKKTEALEHLENIFRPYVGEGDETNIDEIQDYQLCQPTKPTSPTEIRDVIRCLDPKKAPSWL